MMRVVRWLGVAVLLYLSVVYMLDAFGLYDLGVGPR
jgi:hypothetical protein